MKRRLVIMTPGGENFGYFSNVYGLTECECPVSSSFLDPDVPLTKHIKRIMNAKARTLLLFEKRMDTRRDQDLRFMTDWSSKEYKDAVELFEAEKKREWIIVDLTGTSVAIV